MKLAGLVFIALAVLSVGMVAAQADTAIPVTNYSFEQDVAWNWNCTPIGWQGNVMAVIENGSYEGFYNRIGQDGTNIAIAHPGFPTGIWQTVSTPAVADQSYSLTVGVSSNYSNFAATSYDLTLSVNGVAFAHQTGAVDAGHYMTDVVLTGVAPQSGDLMITLKPNGDTVA